MICGASLTDVLEIGVRHVDRPNVEVPDVVRQTPVGRRRRLRLRDAVRDRHGRLVHHHRVGVRSLEAYVTAETTRTLPQR